MLDCCLRRAGPLFPFIFSSATFGRGALLVVVVAAGVVVVIGLMDVQPRGPFIGLFFRRLFATSCTRVSTSFRKFVAMVMDCCKMRNNRTSYSNKFIVQTSKIYPLATYYWTVPLILDHLYLVWKLTSSKIADTKVSGF